MAIAQITHKNSAYSIAYHIINNTKDEVILFLHGWGSNKEVMISAFKNSFTMLKHIYIDMPGFGKSSNDNVLDTKGYSDVLKSFLNKKKIYPKYIVGHSFGGKVGLLMSPPNLILLSSAGILCKKSIAIRLKIFIFKILKKIIKSAYLLNFFKAKDAQNMPLNMYETFKKVVNEDFKDNFKNYSRKVDIFWGENDKATPLSSGFMMHKYIKGSRFYVLKGDHYFFLDKGDMISQKTLETIQNV